MQSTLVEASAEADFDSTAPAVIALVDARCQKLVRFAHVKAQLRQLRAEYNQLEEELFGAAAEEGL